MGGIVCMLTRLSDLDWLDTADNAPGELGCNMSHFGKRITRRTAGRLDFHYEPARLCHHVKLVLSCVLDIDLHTSASGAATKASFILFYTVLVLRVCTVCLVTLSAQILRADMLRQRPPHPRLHTNFSHGPEYP